MVKLETLNLQKEQPEDLADRLLGYANPRKEVIDRNAERALQFARSAPFAPTSFSGCHEMISRLEHKVRLLERGMLREGHLPSVIHLRPKIEAIRDFVRGGVFADCGYGVFPASDLANFLEMSERVFIDFIHSDPETIGSVREDTQDGVHSLWITDDMTRAISHMFDETVHLFHFRALEVFEGDPNLLWEEVHRVLLNDGYVAIDFNAPVLTDARACHDLFEFDIDLPHLKFLKKGA